MNKKIGSRYLPYCFLTPAIVFLLLFMAYPILNVFYYSLQNYATNKPYLRGFVGLDNMMKILTGDKVFRASLLVSVKWVVVQVGLQLVFGLMIALVLNQRFKGRGILRAIVFAPWAVSGVLTSMMWSLMYNENMGVVNDLLMKMGIIKKGIAWISGYGTSFAALTVAELWRGIRFLPSCFWQAFRAYRMRSMRRVRLTEGPDGANSSTLPCRILRKPLCCPPYCGRYGSLTMWM